jgi:uncharacterized membrane protein
VAGMHAAVTIQRPVNEVYGFFLDLERTIPATDPTVDSVRRLPAESDAACATYIIRQPVFGKVREQRMLVIPVEANHRLDIHAAFGPVRPHLQFSFVEDGSSTRVEMRGDSQPIGPLALVTPLMDRIGQKNWERRLPLIKAALESEAK